MASGVRHSSSGQMHVDLEIALRTPNREIEGRTEDLVVEHGEVQRQSQADRVRHDEVGRRHLHRLHVVLANVRFLWS